MNKNAKKVLFHWTTMLMGGGMLMTPLSIIADRKKNFADITGAEKHIADEKLRKLVDEELAVVLKRRRWLNSKPTNVQIEVQYDVESTTGGFFFFLSDAIFRFSTRLALDESDDADAVAEIRRRYPNFFDIFKCNFASQSEWNVRKIWRNFRTALGFRDLAKMFEEKDLFHLSVDSSSLSDDDIRTVFLSENAKKFAIARELLSADRIAEFKPFVYSLVAFSLGWFVFLFAKSKMRNERLAVAVAYALAVFIMWCLDHAEQMRTVVKTDIECMALGDAYVSGAKDYLRASIRLGECIHRLTDGQARFDLFGDYERHIVPYSKRLQIVEEEEKRLLEDRTTRRKQTVAAAS
ncbi:hypothetical protein niasHT_025581 [Heterodera trifolii]|uniref:Uncharacterized protein n=1 Tax=Heterodera trifolii TaxID=157864 RepID=A0ABD2K8A7_9BILA